MHVYRLGYPFDGDCAQSVLGADPPSSQALGESRRGMCKPREQLVSIVPGTYMNTITITNEGMSGHSRRRCPPNPGTVHPDGGR